MTSTEVTSQLNLKKIFGNVEGIRKLNLILLKNLETYYLEYKKGEVEGKKQETLGSVLLKIVPFLRTYHIYCKGYEDVQQLIRKLKKVEKFKQFLIVSLQNKIRNKKPIY
jgi:hypothetical protein